MEANMSEIRNLILDEIDPEKIYILDMGPIYLIAVVWDRGIPSFEKRVMLRKLLRFTKKAFDISAYTSKEFNDILKNKTSLTYEIVRSGNLVYEKAVKAMVI